MENLRDAFNSYKVETVSAKGLIINIDGIECYGLWGSVEKISFQGKKIYKGIGEAIFVDRNHDLSYYINGSDHLDSNNFNELSSTFGYEWGGYDTSVFTAADIGAGLLNTNTLIEMNPQPTSRGWYTIWNKIKEFRQNYSDQWFLPSRGELDLIYKERLNLNNLSTLVNPYYWSSSGYNAIYAWFQCFNKDIQDGGYKGNHNKRSRLCVIH